MRWSRRHFLPCYGTLKVRARELCLVVVGIALGAALYHFRTEKRPEPAPSLRPKATTVGIPDDTPQVREVGTLVCPRCRRYEDLRYERDGTDADSGYTKGREFWCVCACGWSGWDGALKKR